jgi:NADH-quinone oxidoreductase subunit N
MWPAVIALIAGSIIGLFYYLRVIVAICTPAPEGPTAYAGAVPMVSGTTLAALTLILFGLGLYPTPLVHLIQVTAAQLVIK